MASSYEASHQWSDQILRPACEKTKNSEQELSQNILKKNEKKSMRSMSRSTFDSVIDDFIEDDFEKSSAFGVSLVVVIIFSTFFLLFGLALAISLKYQTGYQSKKIAYELCTKFPKWQFLQNSSSSNSWCDDRIFNLPFQLGQQCPCFASQLRPEVVKKLWPYTGVYGTAWEEQPGQITGR